MKQNPYAQSGYALVAFLLLLTIGAAIAATSIDHTVVTMRQSANTEKRIKEFVLAENSMKQAMLWLRANSVDLLNPFKRDQFYTHFVKVTPTTGSNDSSVFTVPTRIQAKSSGGSATTNVPLLASDSTLGSSYFPYYTGGSFNPTSSFQTAMAGYAPVRITLVDAVAVDPSKDYGAPPATTPATEFYPVYRVDAMTGIDKGAHISGYVVGSVSYTSVVGFYGRDFLEFRQNCDSYNSADGTYGGANKRAACPLGSNGPVSIHQNSAIYGSARTNDTFVTSNPFGGDVCADFANGCPNPGQTCAGSTCAVSGLPTLHSFETYCPGVSADASRDRTVSSNQTWTVAGTATNQKCWRNVTLSNKRLTLTSTDIPYYFKTLSFSGGQAKLNIAPSPASGVVTVYVDQISGDNFNGNQMFNANNRPSQLRLYVLSNSTLTLNGNANINAVMVSPNTDVTIQGNFDYQGGLIAKSLAVTGSGAVHYDESLGGVAATDTTYRLRNEFQRYR